MPKDENMTGKILLEWEASEYTEHRRSIDWYWWVGLFAVILLGVAIWQRSFLFGVLVFIGWFTLVLFAVRPPRIIKFYITERGVMIENNLYPWQNLKSFWIFYNPPLKKEISLESKKTFMLHVKMPLGDQNPQKARELLAKFLPEIEQEESLIENISSLLKL